MVANGCFLDRCEIADSVIGIRSNVHSGVRISSSVLLGADVYEDGVRPAGQPTLGLGRDVILNRVIVDKNARIGDGARLVNVREVDHEDGDGYFIRSGIIVVPKGGIIQPGTVV